MALHSPFLSLTPTILKPSITLPSSFSIRLQTVSLGFHPTFAQTVQNRVPLTAHKRVAVITRASVDPGTPDVVASGDSESSSTKEVTTGVENLPLESKLQLKLEQKLKMKLDKKIRLRRNRLNRKRALRKKGRWPPSKMKKLKNV